jgi:uncharacterized membrane protein YbhN (UPF0104 family)
MKRLPGWIKLLLKVAVSAGCLWYVGQKIDWAQTWQLLKLSNKGWLAAAVIFFSMSKAISSLRLNRYFGNLNLYLGEWPNLRLYWLGMFYNLFLPGGIGGDAYKVILLSRKYGSLSAKKITAAVFLDRVSGVAGLGILAAGFYSWLFWGSWYGTLVLLGVLPGLGVYYWMVRRWFPTFLPSFGSTLWLGLAVQVAQVVAVYAIMLSIGIRHQFPAFQFLFLLSSIVAIFPFTIGGLGAREVVFLWGASQFALNKNEAVFISLLFYLISVVVSLIGLLWVYREPLPGPAIQTPAD